MKTLVSRLNKLEEVTLVVMFALMVAFIFLQVIMRYCFHNSLSWSEEAGKFLFVWLSWIGISIGEKRAEHIKITMLVDAFSSKMQHIANIISEIIVITICGVTVYYGILMTSLQWGTTYAGIHISMGWGYLAVVVGCVLMIARCIAMIAMSIQGMKNGEDLHEMQQALIAKYDAELEG